MSDFLSKTNDRPEESIIPKKNLHNSKSYDIMKPNEIAETIRNELYEKFS